MDPRPGSSREGAIGGRQPGHFSDAPGASWVTSLAILAWQRFRAHIKENVKRAVEFLYRNSRENIGKNGHQTPSRTISPSRDGRGRSDTLLLGRSNVLRPAGFGGGRAHPDHPCAEEAVRMLMDRQLDTGGWNYGNTVRLRDPALPPAGPDRPGALRAEAACVQENDVSRSLGYLARPGRRIATPLSLGWALLGLGGLGTANRRISIARVEECVKRQERTGGVQHPGTVGPAPGRLQGASCVAASFRPRTDPARVPGSRRGRGMLAPMVFSLAGCRQPSPSADVFIARMEAYSGAISLPSIFRGNDRAWRLRERRFEASVSS